MRRRRRASRPWTVIGLVAADVVVFVLYALSGSLPVLVAGLVGLVALVVALGTEVTVRRSGRHGRRARPRGEAS